MVHTLLWNFKSGAAKYDEENNKKELTNGLAKRKRLALPGYDYDDLSALENSGDAYRQCHAWDHADIIIEEPRVRKDRFKGKRLDSRAGRQGRT
jgi:hypothetical protein